MASSAAEIHLRATCELYIHIYTGENVENEIEMQREADKKMKIDVERNEIKRERTLL